MPTEFEAKVNGVAVEAENALELRRAALAEMLRQESVAEGMLAADADDETVAGAIESLLQSRVNVPEPGEEELRRYYEAHLSRYSSGETVTASHILLQMTPATPVSALLARAERVLHQALAEPAKFEQLASENSNCPSGQHGGALGQLQRGESVPEFDAALFADNMVGIWPRIVRTRFGFHVLRVEQRVPGRQLPYEQVRSRVAQDLQRNALAQALQQYVRIVAGHHDLQGADLDGVADPLVN